MSHTRGASGTLPSTPKRPAERLGVSSLCRESAATVVVPMSSSCRCRRADVVALSGRRSPVVVPMWPSMAGLIPATVGEGRLFRVRAVP